LAGAFVLDALEVRADRPNVIGVEKKSLGVSAFLNSKRRPTITGGKRKSIVSWMFALSSQPTM